MRKGNLHFNVRHHTMSTALNAGIGTRTTGTHYCIIKSRVSAALFFLLLTAAFITPCLGQDWIKTGTGLGMEKVRLAVPDFKASTAEPKNADLLKVFNDTLWNDLDNAGIFEMVSKSFYPLAVPGTPTDVQFAGWNGPPPNAAMLVFGNLGVTGGNVKVQGWLYDVKNIASPQVLGKQYQDSATSDAVRIIAHKFANEIIFRLGGGIPGIAESQIYFVSSRTGHKEIWVMDYDGANQRQITHLNGISLSPRISPDGSRLAFSSMTKTGWEIMMYSMDLNRVVIGWNQIGLFIISFRRPRNLHCRSIGGKSEARYVFQGSGCFAGMESQDQCANRVGKRAHRPAADLYHGSRRHQCAAAYRPGLCSLAGVVSEWTISAVRLDTTLRAGCSWGIRYLPHGRCQQAVGATDPRWRTK